MTAAQPTTYPWHSQVPRLGSDDEFAALRRLMQEAGYAEKDIMRRLNVESLEKYSFSASESRPLEDPLDALIGLFFDCRFVEEAALAKALPAGTVALFDALNLLVRDPGQPGLVYASAAILPAFGFLTVCDRGEVAPDGTRGELPADVVYPAHMDTTRRFVQGLPHGPCDAMLDVGTGTGIAALLGSRLARQVWASDITGRAALYAEFNRQLAGVRNMTVVEGDMYAPVDGLTFDRIVIHPPYVPAKRTKYVFRDAGEDGEQIIRRAIEGLPRVLRPGGRFYSLQLATDRQDEMFEDRIRKWLGAEDADFDVVVAAHTIRTPSEFFGDSSLRNQVNLEEAHRLIELWGEIKTRFLIYGAVLIERHEAPRRAITTRVQTGKEFDGRLLDWLLRWQQRLNDPDQAEALLDSPPTVTGDCQVHTVSRLHDGRFRMEEFTLRSDQPFRTSFKCEGWLTQVVAECDGTKTWREHMETARADGHVPPGTPLKDSLGLFGLLVTSGVLRIPGWLPPKPGVPDVESSASAP